MAKHSAVVSKRLEAVEKGLNTATEKTPHYTKLYQDFIGRKDEAFDKYMAVLDKNSVNHGTCNKTVLAIDSWDATKTATRIALALLKAEPNVAE